MNELLEALAKLVTALEEIELRTAQARIASTIGKKKDRTDFLCNELQRIQKVARAAIKSVIG